MNIQRSPTESKIRGPECVKARNWKPSSRQHRRYKSVRMCRRSQPGTVTTSRLTYIGKSHLHQYHFLGKLQSLFLLWHIVHSLFSLNNHVFKHSLNWTSLWAIMNCIYQEWTQSANLRTNTSAAIMWYYDDWINSRWNAHCSWPAVQANEQHDAAQRWANPPPAQELFRQEHTISYLQLQLWLSSPEEENCQLYILCFFLAW